jgi:ferritin
MMNEKIERAFNEQIKHELESAYLYVAAAAYFHNEGLDGMAGWMRVQAREEVKHAMRFFDNIRDRDGRVRLLALSQPKGEWSSPLEVWKDAYKHEQFISDKIRSLVKLVAEEADATSTPLLNWFLDEQIEEEAQTLKVVQDLEKVGTSGAALVMLDRHLGKREE